MEKLRALNCLLRSRRRCGYSVDVACRIVDFWCMQSPVDTYIVQYCSSDYENNTALGSKHHTAPTFMTTAEYMACRFHIYSLNCRSSVIDLEISPIVLQISSIELEISPNLRIWKYLQLNWRYKCAVKWQISPNQLQICALQLEIGPYLQFSEYM